jgi:DNA replication protein DnaC
MYKHDNYKKVKDIIEARRLNAIAKADYKNLEVAELSPVIKEIDAELRGVGPLIFKTACAGGDISPIRKRNAELLSLRRAELQRLGLPEDYTEPKYTCQKCMDSGSVGLKICSCLKELLITENIKSSGIGRLIEKQSFDNFDLGRYAYDEELLKMMKRNLKLAKAFAENLENPEKTTLFLIGKTGTGKTHISTSIARIAIEKGYEVLYDSTQNILTTFENDRFRSGYGPYEPQGDKYLECEILIMDDLGTEFINQFALSALYNLINSRQNAGKITIISSNLSQAALRQKYEDRIFSRLVGCDTLCLVFDSKDSRIER